jgi:hypothetical protein
MNPQKIRGELRCSGRVGSSCSTSGTQCVKWDTHREHIGKLITVLSITTDGGFEHQLGQTKHYEN